MIFFIRTWCIIGAINMEQYLPNTRLNDLVSDDVGMHFTDFMASREFDLIYQEAVWKYSNLNPMERSDANGPLAGAIFESLTFQHLQKKAEHWGVLPALQTGLFTAQLINGEDAVETTVIDTYNLVSSDRNKLGYCPDGIRVYEDKIELYEYTLNTQLENFERKIKQARWFKRVLRNNHCEFKNIILHFVLPKNERIPAGMETVDPMGKTIHLPFTERRFYDFFNWLLKNYRPYKKALTLTQLKKEAQYIRQIGHILGPQTDLEADVVDLPYERL